MDDKTETTDFKPVGTKKNFRGSPKPKLRLNFRVPNDVDRINKFRDKIVTHITNGTEIKVYYERTYHLVYNPSLVFKIKDTIGSDGVPRWYLEGNIHPTLDTFIDISCKLADITNVLPEDIEDDENDD